MSHPFDLLSDRKRYASNRRADLLSKFLSESKKKTEWMYTFEVEIESYLKRKVGYAEWDRNWDLGLHLKQDKVYILLSKKNDLGSFSVLEKVEYTNDLDVFTWLSDCMTMYTSFDR